MQSIYILLIEGIFVLCMWGLELGRLRVHGVPYGSYDVRFVVFWSFMFWEDCDGNYGGLLGICFVVLEAFLCDFYGL